MQQSFNKGMKILSKAGNDKDLLGWAFVDFHSTIERYMVQELASKLDASQRKDINWQLLINTWEQTRGLSSQDREYLFQTTKLRNKISHGEAFFVTRQQVENHADFVQKFTGVKKSRRISLRIGEKWKTLLMRLVALILVVALLISGYFIMMYFILNGIISTDGRDGFELMREVTGSDDTQEENERVNEVVEEAISPAPTQSSNNLTEGTISIRVNADSYVREGPGMDFDVVGTVSEDEVFEVLELSSDKAWYKIRLQNEKEGWLGSTRANVISP